MNKKITKKLTIIGVALAIVVIIVSSIMKLSPQTMLSGIVVIWAVLIVVRMYIVNGKNKEHAKMLEHLNKILTEDNDPEKYVQKCKDYSERDDDESFKAMLMLNSAVGYSCMCEYDKAVDVIKSVDLSVVNTSHRAVALNNLAQYLYLSDRNDEATKYVEENLQTLRKYISVKSFTASFSATFSFYYYFKGNKKKAEKYTEEVIEFINKSGSSSEGDMYLKKKLTELLEKIKEMPDPDEQDDE